MTLVRARRLPLGAQLIKLLLPLRLDPLHLGGNSIGILGTSLDAPPNDLKGPLDFGASLKLSLKLFPDLSPICTLYPKCLLNCLPAPPVQPRCPPGRSPAPGAVGPPQPPSEGAPGLSCCRIHPRMFLGCNLIDILGTSLNLSLVILEVLQHV